MVQTDARRLLSANFLFGLVIGLLSLVFIFYFVPAFIAEPPRLKSQMLSPRWLPTVMGWACFILALSLCIGEVIYAEIVARHKTEKSIHVFVLFGVILTYALLFDSAGAILCGVVSTCALFAARTVRPFALYAFAIGIPVVVYFFFTELLEVPLPLGFFFQ